MASACKGSGANAVLRGPVCTCLRLWSPLGGRSKAPGAVFGTRGGNRNTAFAPQGFRVSCPAVLSGTAVRFHRREAQLMIDLKRVALRPLLVLLTGALFAFGAWVPGMSGSAAEEKASGPITRGPLRGLPGEPGPHVKKIKALADNTWLDLGAPKPDPKWGRARGRSWMAAMPVAPELRGAFLFGEGVHGHVKPDGHYMDDLWFYDINGHRWICCYPGADTKTLALTLNRDGFEIDKDGELIPVASQVHGYSMNTYDTDQRRFLSMPNLHGYWERPLAQRKKWLKPAPADPSPWMFETRTGRWNRLRTGTTAPKSGYGDTLIYLPSRKQAFFAHRNQEVWFYDTRKNTWKQAKPKGPPPPFGIDATSCYDPKRERIYIGGGSYPVAPDSGHAFWIYDLKRDLWVDPKPKGKPCRGSNSYSTLNALMVYDPVSDRVLLVNHSFHYGKEERVGVYVYDPEANTWSTEPLELPKKLRNRQAKNGFYDAELNAVFLHSAGDSQDDGVVWVYRYRNPR
jgi:hypothetical protein